MATFSLKGVKHAAHLSRETEAFTATLCHHGREVAHVRNEGSGGATIATFARSVPSEEILLEAGQGVRKVAAHEVLDRLADIADRLFWDWLDAKEAKRLERWRARTAATNAKKGFPVTVFFDSRGGLVSVGMRAPEHLDEVLLKHKVDRAAATVVGAS